MAEKKNEKSARRFLLRRYRWIINIGTPLMYYDMSATSAKLFTSTPARFADNKRFV